MEMGVECFEGWKVAREVGDDDLEDVARVKQILEAMKAQVPKVDPGGQVIGDDAACCLRDEDLAAVTRCADARRTVHIQPNIALPTPLGLPGMHAHACRDGYAVRPRT